MVYFVFGNEWVAIDIEAARRQRARYEMIWGVNEYPDDWIPQAIMDYEVSASNRLVIGYLIDYCDWEEVPKLNGHRSHLEKEFRHERFKIAQTDERRDRRDCEEIRSGGRLH